MLMNKYCIEASRSRTSWSLKQDLTVKLIFTNFHKMLMNYYFALKIEQQTDFLCKLCELLTSLYSELIP